MFLKKAISPRRAESKHPLLGEIEGFGIVRRDILRCAHSICIPLTAAAFQLFDLLRQSRAESKAFERTLCVPKLCNSRFLTEIYIRQRHKIIVEKNIFRCSQSVCAEDKKSESSRNYFQGVAADLNIPAGDELYIVTAPALKLRPHGAQRIVEIGIVRRYQSHPSPFDGEKAAYSENYRINRIENLFHYLIYPTV